MSFMQPEIWQESYYELDTTNGREIIPVSVCGLWDRDISMTPGESIVDHFGNHIDGDLIDGDIPALVENRWLYRLSAPGYMDCTNTGSADSEAEAVRELLDMYGSDSDEPEEWEEELQERLREIELSENLTVGSMFQSADGAIYRLNKILSNDMIRVSRITDGSEVQYFIWRVDSLMELGMRRIENPV